MSSIRAAVEVEVFSTWGLKSNARAVSPCIHHNSPFRLNVQ